MVYKMKVAGVERDLKLCPLNDTLSIAAFVLFGDVELTEHCAAALLEKAPAFDVYAEHVKRLYTGKGITEIGSGVFSGLKRLNRVEIKEGVRSIKKRAFHAPMLETLILPETLTEMSGGY
jgi:hypothetical protein